MAQIETEFEAEQSYSNYGAGVQESEFGGEEDLWGASAIDVAALLDDTFEIQFDAVDIGGVLVQVDSIEIEVFYNKPQLEAPESVDTPPFVPAPWAASAIGPKPSGQGHRIVLVGLKGRVAYSDDNGVTWTASTSGVADTLWDVTYVNGEYVAVGDNGTVITSSDGVTWSTVSVDINRHIYSVARDKSTSGVAVAGRSGAMHTRHNGDWLPGTIGVR